MTNGNFLYALDVKAFARELLGFQPDEMQAKVLDGTVHRGMLNCTRQWGKSTVCAILGLHRAIYMPETVVVVAAPTERQSAELVRKMERFAAKLGMRPRGDGDNAVSLLLPNGSRVIGLPGQELNIRGFTASLALIDEAAGVTEEVYRAIRPMLAVGKTDPETGAKAAGDMWLLSTPRGKQGFFYREWMNPRLPWTRISVPATECPRIPKEFLAEERETLGEQCFARDYLCQFVNDEDYFFREEDVRPCLTEEILPLGLGGASYGAVEAGRRA